MSDDVERPDEPDEVDTPDEPDERRRWSRWRGRMSRPAVIGAGVAVAIVAGAGWVVVRGDGEPELSPAQVLSAFFQAQGDGDCERLLDLVSEASWSNGGERSRAEFLDQCGAALDGYQPAVDRLDIDEVDEDGDRLTVVWPPGFAPAVFDTGEEGDEEPEGTLVREGGRWRVRLDDLVLHLGRSVDETIRGYLDAYNEADCPRLAGYLSESVWSADVRTSAEFVRQCRDETGGRQRVARPRVLAATEIGVSVEEEDRAEAAVSMTLGGRTLSGDAGETETVQLVREGLQWKLAGSEDLPDEWAGAPMRTVAYAELEARLVDEVVTDTTCSRYLDDPPVDSGAGAGSRLGITRSFSSCYAQVSVYRYSDGERASQSARSMANAIINDPLPTASDLAATQEEHDIGSDLSLADLQEYVDTLRPNHAAAVPGLPAATGVRTRCDVEGCSAASAFVTRGPVVLAVTMEVGDLDDAARIMSAQLERL